jgi:hypothetical protein
MVLRIPRPEGYDSGDDGEAPLRPVQELREDPGHSATIMMGSGDPNRPPPPPPLPEQQPGGKCFKGAPMSGKGFKGHPGQFQQCGAGAGKGPMRMVQYCYNKIWQLRE